jgi:hypothetical protein
MTFQWQRNTSDSSCYLQTTAPCKTTSVCGVVESVSWIQANEAGAVLWGRQDAQPIVQVFEFVNAMVATTFVALWRETGFQLS